VVILRDCVTSSYARLNVPLLKGNMCIMVDCSSMSCDDSSLIQITIVMMRGFLSLRMRSVYVGFTC